jgi:hypothetical protein
MITMVSIGSLIESLAAAFGAGVVCGLFGFAYLNDKWNKRKKEKQ